MPDTPPRVLDEQSRRLKGKEVYMPVCLIGRRRAPGQKMKKGVLDWQVKKHERGKASYGCEKVKRAWYVLHNIDEEDDVVARVIGVERGACKRRRICA